MRRRGQVDQIMSSFVVVFAVFFLMAAFVIVTSNIGAVINKGMESPNHIENILLTQEIKLSFDEQEKEMLVIEAVALERQGQLGRGQFEESLKSLIKENECFILTISNGKEKDIGNLAILSGSFEGKNPGQFLGVYQNKRALVKNDFIVEDKKIFTESYYGECLYE